MAFETMAALYVEVEPVLWEGGRFSLCNTVLMTGIQGQCQVQVETRMMAGGTGRGWNLPSPNITAGGLIQSSSVVR